MIVLDNYPAIIQSLGSLSLENKLRRIEMDYRLAEIERLEKKVSSLEACIVEDIEIIQTLRRENKRLEYGWSRSGDFQLKLIEEKQELWLENIELKKKLHDIQADAVTIQAMNLGVDTVMEWKEKAEKWDHIEKEILELVKRIPK